jgi:thiosulfate dehydrogenase
LSRCNYGFNNDGSGGPGGVASVGGDVVDRVGGYAVLSNGAISANADAPPSALETVIADMSLDATLRNEAPKMDNPIAMTDANLISGIELYGTHCAICHGTSAGDASASSIAKGENPKPPQLATDGVEDDPESWTYWKVKHGIRWTGTPAWKDELNDDQIWTSALFLKHMDKLPPVAAAKWRALGQTSGGCGKARQGRGCLSTDWFRVLESGFISAAHVDLFL